MTEGRVGMTWEGGPEGREASLEGTGASPERRGASMEGTGASMEGRDIRGPEGAGVSPDGWEGGLKRRPHWVQRKMSLSVLRVLCRRMRTSLGQRRQRRGSFSREGWKGVVRVTWVPAFAGMTEEGAGMTDGWGREGRGSFDRLRTNGWGFPLGTDGWGWGCWGCGSKVVLLLMFGRVGAQKMAHWGRPFFWGQSPSALNEGGLAWASGLGRCQRAQRVYIRIGVWWMSRVFWRIGEIRSGRGLEGVWWGCSDFCGEGFWIPPCGRNDIG